MSPEETDLIDNKIRKMLNKGAMSVAKNLEGQLLSLLLWWKNRWREWCSDQSERIEENGPLCILQDGRSVLVEKNATTWRLPLEDIYAYFAVTSSKNFQKYARLQWKGLLHEFLCLSFGLSSAPRVFPKLMKVLISLLWKLCIRIVKYLGNMLLTDISQEVLLIALDTLILRLQNLRFLINTQSQY